MRGEFGTWRFDLEDVREEIEFRGYVNLRSIPTEAALRDVASRVGSTTGANSVGVTALEGEGSPTWLPRHTESLTYSEPELLQCFALGCLLPSAEGGATCLYDGRRAAKALLGEIPELAGVQMRFWSTVYPGQAATHPLVWDDPVYGRVLRYRSEVHTNTVAGLPPGLTERELYQAAERAIDASLILVHVWRPGDLLVVNNRFMIHTREPFAGRRKMLRFRYDDPHFRTIELRRKWAA
ncbi:TauD/TfdA family dioxygenase [Longispora albida]|uniref:TauD/TfdA family dioxygenase n=1 Tax=Longispora albida TaxID=203523 RepID=UPI00037486A1|nr:TauD/TfdA family dioxygenase [Longispora albida]